MEFSQALSHSSLRSFAILRNGADGIFSSNKIILEETIRSTGKKEGFLKLQLLFQQIKWEGKAKNRKNQQQPQKRVKTNGVYSPRHNNLFVFLLSSQLFPQKLYSRIVIIFHAHCCYMQVRE